MTRRRSLAVALVSMALIALELVWTRILSAEFFYTFAFLVLSLSVLGLGLGALSARLTAASSRGPDVVAVLTGAGLAALAGPSLVFQIGIDFSIFFSSAPTFGKFLLTLLLLGAPFFLGGHALARIFREDPMEIPRLYMADLIGAGLGVLLAVSLMNRIGTPLAALLVSTPLLAGGILLARGRRRALPFVPLVLLALLARDAGGHLEARREERGRVIYKHWDALAKIKVYDFDGTYRGINIDNVANSPVLPFDGDWDAFRADTTGGGWDIDVGYLVAQFDSCKFLSLGAGGGMDVMHALDRGATEVHAVEVNPHINRMMLDGDPAGYLLPDSSLVDSGGRVITLAEYSGHVYRDPRVTVVSEDARTYVRRHENEFDVIFSLSSNTWAALASGSFALAENYLFTTEAFRDYWRALTPGGFLSMEHQVYMPRLVSEVIDALEGLGVEDPRSHFAVYNLPKLRRNLLLLSRRPLTDELRHLAYGALTPERHEEFHLLYPAADSLSHNLIHRIATEGRRAAADSAKIDLTPCTDNRPFVAQMGLWRNLERDRLQRLSQYAEFGGFPLSKLMLLIILAVAGLLVLPLTFVPHLGEGPRLRAIPWLYFFVIGIAFMAIEIVLIQQFSLFIGASVHSITTVLLTLLIASGIGSRFARRVPARTAIAGIAVWLILDVLALPTVTGALVSLDLPLRVVVTVLLIAPLGFCLGIPFPKGVLRVGELVDWGFAVNGVGSVIGGTLAVLVAITAGFGVTLLGAAVLYLGALLLRSLRSAW